MDLELYQEINKIKSNGICPNWNNCKFLNISPEDNSTDINKYHHSLEIEGFVGIEPQSVTIQISDVSDFSNIIFDETIPYSAFYNNRIGLSKLECAYSLSIQEYTDYWWRYSYNDVYYANGIKSDDTKFSTGESILFNTFGSGLGRYVGAALAPNGKIYAVPYSAGNILEIDPDTRTTTTFGSGIGHYYGATLAPNGKIYAMPDNTGNILEIDPDTRTTTTFGSGIGRYWGSALAPNGKIYAVPYNWTDGNILEIDPDTRTTTTFGSGLGHYWGAALAPNGKIYGVPRNTGNILEINPDTRTVTTFGSGLEAYYGATLAPNGKIYAVPNAAGDILEINPDTRTVSTFGGFLLKSYYDAALAPNGKIYGTSYGSILEIDPDARTATPFDTGLESYYGAALAPNGKIYAVPYSAGNILEINPEAFCTPNTIPYSMDFAGILDPWDPNSINLLSPYYTGSI